MNAIPARAVAVGSALDAYPHLPLCHLFVGKGKTGITVPSSYYPGFNAIREVAQWAREFGTEIVLSLSHGNADARTEIELGDEQVHVSGTFGTAQAYELGRLLQRPLSNDTSVRMSADELLAVIGIEAGPA
jgi:hypothetical protein